MPRRYLDLDGRRRLMQRGAIARHLVEEVAGATPVMQGMAHVAAREAAGRADVVAHGGEVGEEAAELLGQRRRDRATVAEDANPGVAAV